MIIIFLGAIVKRIEKYFQTQDLPTLKISQSAYDRQVKFLTKYISNNECFLLKDTYALIRSIFQHNPFVPELQAFAKIELDTSYIDSGLLEKDFDSIAEFVPTKSLHVPLFKININSPYLQTSINNDDWSILLQTIGHEYGHYLQWILISTKPTKKRTAMKAQDLKDNIFENFLTYQEVFDCAYYVTNDTLFARYLAENIAYHDYEKRKYEEEAESFGLHFAKKLLKTWKKTTSSKDLKTWCNKQLLLCDKNKLKDFYIKQKNVLHDAPVYRAFIKIMNKIDYSSFINIVSTPAEILFTDNPFLLELEALSQQELATRKDNFLRAIMQSKKDEEYLKFFNSALKDENYEAVKFLISFMPSCASKPKSQKQISEKLFQATESQDKRTLLISPQERVKELLKKNEFDQLTKYLLHSENLKISSR